MFDQEACGSLARMVVHDHLPHRKTTKMVPRLEVLFCAMAYPLPFRQRNYNIPQPERLHHKSMETTFFEQNSSIVRRVYQHR
jgi:hypothetical protein